MQGTKPTNCKGRAGNDEGIGKYTTTNESVIDYMIARPKLFEEVKDFEISDFNPLFFLMFTVQFLTFGIVSRTKKTFPLNKQKIVRKIRWDGTRNSDFMENLDNGDLERLNDLLENFSPIGDQINSDVELFVKQTK